MKDYINDFLPADRSARILDIGCGEGYVLKQLTERGYKNCIGVDIDRRSLQVCREKGLPVEHIDDLARYLAAHRDEFDVINMKEVVYYFPDDKMLDYLGHVKAALKKDGRLIVEVFNGALLTGAHILYKDYKIKRVFTDYGIKRLLEDAGFRVTHLFGTTIRGSSLKRVMWKFFRYLWVKILQSIYMIEFGSSDDRPVIWSKLIVAVATKA